MQIHDLLPTLNSFTESESVKEREWDVKSDVGSESVKEREWDVKSDVGSGKQTQTEAQTQEHIKSMQFTER